MVRNQPPRFFKDQDMSIHEWCYRAACGLRRLLSMKQRRYPKFRQVPMASDDRGNADLSIFKCTFVGILSYLPIGILSPIGHWKESPSTKPTIMELLFGE